MAKKRKKTQTLSFDVLIAVGVFIAAVILLIYIVSQPRGSRESLEELVEEGETISSQLISPGSEPVSDTTIVVKNQLEKEKLAQLKDIPYDELRTMLGVNGDFCIHFEDEKGNLVDLDDRPAWVQYSIGSPKLNYTVVVDPEGTPVERSLQCGVVEPAS